jgi:hypothetical protein
MKYKHKKSTDKPEAPASHSFFSFTSLFTLHSSHF